MNVTIRDVAARAGVSVRTVSRVLNNQGEIAADTRERVVTAIDELKYRPSALARSLVSGKTHSIGLIIPKITDPFYPEVVLGVESVAREQNYNVFLCNANEDPQQELEYADVMESKQVDGIILCGSRLNTEQLDHLAAQHRVSMLTSRRPHTAAVIGIQGEVGLFEITSHLIRQGHQAIGHIGWSVYAENERADGYSRALRENSIIVQDRWNVSVAVVSIETGQQATRRLLEQSPEITAITCFNDLLAFGALQACVELGRRVPQDIAVVGFDDIPYAALANPPLTTMRIPRYALGKMVMEMLLRVIAADGKHQELQLVKPELVVRRSSGPLERSQ